MGEERPESFLLPRPIYPLPSIRYFTAWVDNFLRDSRGMGKVGIKDLS